MKTFFRKLGWLTKRSDKEAELRDEIQFHLEEEAERAHELPEHEARWAARRELGNLALLQEDTRAAWGWTRLEQLARDARYGLWQLRRNPTFSLVSIATLALGIGGITAMFSAVDAVLIRPLPYADPDRLVVLWDDMGKIRDLTRHMPAPAEWIEWRKHNTVFTDIAATRPGDAMLSGDSEPEQVPARRATANLWNTLGVKPMMGRVFTEEEDVNGVQVIVISHGLWQRRYGGSPDVLGRKVSMNDKPFEIVGILPPDFYFLPSRDIDIWMPASFPSSMLRNFTWHDAHIVARLKPGVTLQHAEDAMSALSLQVTAKDFRGPHKVWITTLREDIAGKTQTALIVLLFASAALLLIACANLASLLMSRASVRNREVAVRTALGAGRGRLLAQFLTESLVLAGLGAIAGLTLAIPAMRFLQTLVPETMGEVRFALDWRVLAFSAAAAIAATLAFGLAPALRSTRAVPNDGLREGGRGSAGARSHWFQHSVIVAETALAVVLLTGGGLLLQAFQHFRNTDLGFRSERLLTFESSLLRYPDFHKRVAFVNAELASIRAIPGVVSAAAISRIPLTVTDQATFYRMAGQEEANISKQVALTRVVTRDYFSTVGARLREGRFFDAADQNASLRPAVVNETFANREFAGRSPIGAQFKFGATGEKGAWYTVVGVVKEMRDAGVTEVLRPTIYRMHEHADQTKEQLSGIVVRTGVNPNSIVPAVRKAIWSIDNSQPIARIRTIEEIVARQLSTSKQSTTLLSAFALLALLLASLGLYGVLSYAVTQRTNEIGVRMALGATSSQILIAFGKRGVALTLAGLAIGLALAANASRFMSTLLYGFQPDYIPTIASVSLTLLTAGALACFVPARRASRVDPAITLRNE